MGIHELGIEHNNLRTAQFLHNDTTRWMFIHRFMDARDHNCQRKYDVFLDAPTMDKSIFGCEEIFDFIQRKLNLWTSGEYFKP